MVMMTGIESVGRRSGSRGFGHADWMERESVLWP